VSEFSTRLGSCEGRPGARRSGRRIERACLVALGITCLSCAAPVGKAPFEHTVDPGLPSDIRSCLEQPAVRDYFEAAHGKIIDAWEVPPGATADQSVEVRLQISEEGEVESADVVSASAPEFEASVLDAIEAAEPLPPLPVAASCMRGRAVTATFQNPDAARVAARGQSETYIRRVGAAGPFRNTYLLHWPVKKMPLSVYLPPPPDGLFADPEAVYAAVRNGVLGWTDVASPGVPGFRFVDSHSEADIPVIWADEPDGDWYIAFCSFQVSTTQLRFGVEQILVTGRWSDGRIAEPEEIEEVVLHETGHALGLIGHSEDPRDIMYPSVVEDRSPGLSERDRATLRELYSRGNRQIRGRRGRPGI
jgi:TonB family protein